MISNGLFEETNEQRIFLKYFTINPYNALFGFKFLKNCRQFHCTGLLVRCQKCHSIYSKFSVEWSELTPSFKNAQEVA